MDGEDCCEPWAAELSEDVEYARIICLLANQPQQVRRMKLPVLAGRHSDQSVQFLLSRIQHAL
jgi:hypothetical protein